MDVFVIQEFDGAEPFVFASLLDAIASVRYSYSNTVPPDDMHTRDVSTSVTQVVYERNGIKHIAASIKRTLVRTKAEHL